MNILFIVGDVFDRGLPVNHRDVPYIVSWMRRLLARCARRGIVVIVLEGTPSHDRLQSQLFVAINDSAEEADRCDLRYIKEVSIEYIEKYDINLLCIPDEKNTSDEVTYHQVKEIMKSRALEKVDFAIMHGFFEFQVPVGRHSRFHNSEAYLDLVKYLIFIGHDHAFQQHGRIFVQGSPDRQRHGMEEDKGFVRAKVNRDGSYRATFEVNEYAKIFKTVTIDEDVDLANRQVRDVCNAVAPNSHIRVAARKSHPVLHSLDSFEALFPLIKFSKKVLDEDEQDTESIIAEIESEAYTPFTIDSSNIKSLVEERLPTTLSAEEKIYFDSLMAGLTKIKA